jgi:tRNA pseudouridine38-40 synthase
METRSFRITVAYRGTSFQGWQKQTRTDSTVQEHLEKAFRKITGAKKSIPHGSGRTDAGVHARAQVAHIRIATKLSTERLEKALNAHLPIDIRVLKVEEAEEKFHAQRDVTAKTYRYFIMQSAEGGHTNWPFLAPYTWFVSWNLDVEKMRAALNELIGEHDFKSFQNTGTDVPHTIREILSAEIIEHKIGKRGDFPWLPGPEIGYRLIEVRLQGTGFLKQMVRTIVGTLVEIGRGKTAPSDMEKILKQKSRKASGITAPPYGLFLDHVEY